MEDTEKEVIDHDSTESNGEPNTEAAKEVATSDKKLDKMVNATMELLRRHNAKGIDGEVGVYDAHVISYACQKILSGAVQVDTGYGITMSRLYFETANLI